LRQSSAVNYSACTIHNRISYLQCSSNLSTLLRKPITHHPAATGSTHSSLYLSLPRPPVSSSLRYCNRSLVYTAPDLWNRLPKDIPQFARPLTNRLSSSLIRLHSPLLHSTHDWRPNSSSYPILILLLSLQTSAIITDCNRSSTLSPGLGLTGFSNGTETKQEVWLLRTWFGIAPVNKLVSLAWFLWSLRSFRRFTLHYIRGVTQCSRRDLQGAKFYWFDHLCSSWI